MQSGVCASLVDDSWQRSRDYGLQTGGSIDLQCLDRGELDSRQQEYRKTLEHLQEYVGLFERLQGGRQSRLLFADNSGTILHSSGCDRFGGKASQLMLEPGARWDERSMGTNAIGTALHSATDVQVLGRQHFMTANRGISCSASPVFDPLGRLHGVLDISSEEQEHSQNMLFCARLLALCVENALVSSLEDVHWLLNLAPDSIYMQQPWSGLLALDEAGRVVGANRIARILLPELQTQQLLEELVPGQLTRLDGLTALLTRKLPVRKLRAVPAAQPSADRQPEPQVDARALALLDAGIALLLQGETGVGKDHLVRQLHAGSKRRNGPLIAVNCGALPASLIEAELFGYKAGAFTGSDRGGRLGYVRAADKGILFLDEIGELPLTAQTRLLRVLQDKSVTPVGSHVAEPVDFHVVAATNRDLQQMVAEGGFREDLYFRLKGYQLTLRPLREYEREEFCSLVQQLLANSEVRSETRPLAPELLQELWARDWPGNIRQLKQVLDVALVLAGDEVPALEHFPGLPESSTPVGEAADCLKRQGREHALRVLDGCGGNISAAARQLGISRTTLYSYLKKK